ncbi:methyltransferase [Aliidiomarina minuta]|uniref:Methyltransferase n=1 Tax=Aliidiomarina minuta TaxID=880057 RepID=A0A432W443_9GAMM|nr:class I SAM-dependent methyltransferase [Aliidiomarina minuta]RUO24092.1 methyltransferase [Aliidiomarina minuta]
MNTWLITSALAASLMAGAAYALPQTAAEEALEQQEAEEEILTDPDHELLLDEGHEPFINVDEPPTLQQAVDAASRDPDNRARDEFRNPAETLEFFDVQPHMTVVEIWPGAGWYTEILAPYLYATGTYYAAHFPEDTESAYFSEARGRYAQFLQSSAIYENVQVTSFMPGSEHEIAPEGSADRVLTFRNLHNWYMRDGEEGMENAFDAFYAALRPGGILGVVDHRLPEDRDDDEVSTSGYMKQSWAVKYAEEAGFELVASSEINANPADTADYADGVWTLPPTMRRGDEDAQRYLDIGESDRFTLKFRKPEE